MGGVDGAFDEAISRIESARKKMGKTWDDIVDHVNWAMKFLPDSVADQVKKATQKLGGDYHKADGWLLAELVERGSPSALRHAAEVWTKQVEAVAGNYATDLGFGSMPSNNKWKGPAQLAYRSIIDQQTKALSDFQGELGKLNTTLNDIADAVRNFWVAIAGAVLLMAAALVVCALEVLGIVTAEAAITTAIGGVAVFFGTTFTAYSMIHGALDGHKATLDGLVTKFHQDGTWPAAAADISDASVLDGDNTSDWEPNL